MAPQITMGSPVKGEDFFNRQTIVKEIWVTLERSSILLVAPRRFGKTSIMFKLRDKPKKGFKVLLFDVEHIETPQEFILEIFEEIQKDVKLWQKITPHLKLWTKKFGQNLEEVEFNKIRLKLRENKSSEWKDLGKELLAALTRQEKNLLLILDEFPEMIKLMIERDRRNSTNQATVFLAWLKRLRTNLSDDLKIRFIVGGSICLETIVGKIQCGPKISDMTRIKVGPFSRKSTISLIRELLDSEGITLTPKVQQAILEQVGTPIPYFIQIMIGILARESRNQKKEITPEFVRQVYENQVLGSDYKTCFEHYHSRLAEYYIDSDRSQNKVRAAKTILTEMSIVQDVPKRLLYQIYLDETKQTKDEDGFGELMGLLEDEYYLEYSAEAESYRFYSKLLRDWWYRHFGMLEGRREGN